MSMPHLAELQEKYVDKGVQIISISDEDLETVEGFLKTKVPAQKGAKGGEGAKTSAEVTATYCLTTFGRATRETGCSGEVKMEPNLGQALHLMSGENSHAKVRDGGAVKRMLDAKKTPAEIVTELYLRCVSRKPTDEELKSVEAQLAGEKNMQLALEDLFWALLNSREFLFNH